MENKMQLHLDFVLAGNKILKDQQCRIGPAHVGPQKQTIKS